MQKIKIISFTILLSFILNSNSKLFSEDDSQNTNIDQTKKERTFWQTNKGLIIAVSGVVVLLTTSGLWWLLNKEEKNKKNKDETICDWEKLKDKTVNDPVPSHIRYYADENGDGVITDLDTGQKYSMQEWFEKYIGTDKEEKAKKIQKKAFDEWCEQGRAKLLEAQEKRKRDREKETEEKNRFTQDQVEQIIEKYVDNIARLEKERHALLKK